MPWGYWFLIGYLILSAWIGHALALHGPVNGHVLFSFGKRRLSVLVALPCILIMPAYFIVFLLFGKGDK